MRLWVERRWIRCWQNLEDGRPLWLGSEYGCGRCDAGELGGVKSIQGGCGGSAEKRTCIPAVEPTLAVRGGGMVMAERILLDLTRYELLVLVRFGRGGEETPESGRVVGHEW